MTSWQAILALTSALFSGGALAKLFDWRKAKVESSDKALQVLSQTVDKMRAQQELDHARIDQADKSSKDCESRYSVLAIEVARMQKINIDQSTANSRLQLALQHQAQDIATLRQEQAILRERDRNLRRKLEIEETGRIDMRFADKTPAERPSKK